MESRGRRSALDRGYPVAPVPCLSPQFPTLFCPASGSQLGLGGSRRIRSALMEPCIFNIGPRIPAPPSPRQPFSSNVLSHLLLSSCSNSSGALRGKEGAGGKGPLLFSKLRQAWRWVLPQASQWGSKPCPVSGRAWVLWPSGYPGRGLSWLGTAFLGRAVWSPAL